VWHFPAGEVPADLAAEAPQPEAWDAARLWSYYPLGQSRCPGAETVGAQNLVINLAFCGDWAGANWETPDDRWVQGPTWQDYWSMTHYGPSCAGRHGWAGFEKPDDACTAHVLDEEANAHLAESAYFNFTHIKMFVPVG